MCTVHVQLQGSIELELDSELPIAQLLIIIWPVDVDVDIDREPLLTRDRRWRMSEHVRLAKLAAVAAWIRSRPR